MTFRGQVGWSLRWGLLALALSLAGFGLNGRRNEGEPGTVLWSLSLLLALPAGFLLVLGVGNRLLSRGLWRLVVRWGWQRLFLTMAQPNGVWLWWVHTDAEGKDLDA